ncbi:hypothetical protein PMG11_07181 [Penicillium brasilianum]|uniref:F-box domain protein n=1 Tax=Penicillium brasilianum TaxID=104259 RepID=A0A0F7TU00_PENBI|nr:hypothetical protein PMG11_07181 [Penicillium brasilianum]
MAFMSLYGLSGLDEMSILNIPVGFSTVSSVPSERMLSLGRISSQYRLKFLLLGFVGPETWPSGDRTTRIVRPGATFDLLIYQVRLTLRHLSISNWGFYMKNPPRPIAGDLILPVLECLELRGCGFTSDNTLSWILRHRGTLRPLKLDDCAIIFSMELGAWSPAETETAHVSIEFNGSKAMANGLPRLQIFQFGSSRVRAPGEIGPVPVFRAEIPEGPKFGHTNKFLFGHCPDRYLEMKDGEGNFPWALRQGPRCRRKARPAADEGDLAALRRLLESIGQVVRENNTSSHAASVNNFIGLVEPN